MEILSAGIVGVAILVFACSIIWRRHHASSPDPRTLGVKADESKKYSCKPPDRRVSDSKNSKPEARVKGPCTDDGRELTPPEIAHLVQQSKNYWQHQPPKKP